MTFRIMSAALLLLTAPLAKAQDFLDGAQRFSGNKEAYLTLSSGEEVTGFVEDLNRKKGLISSIVLKDTDGKETTYAPDQVKHMYLAPTGYDQFVQGSDKAFNAARWNEDQSAHAQHIKSGYVFFETTEVMVKKKKMTLLLQLVNPGFANGIKVYFDPFATETGGVSVGGLQVSGGDKRSYYFKKGDATAVRIGKKEYDDESAKLYKGCSGLKKEFPKGLKWSQVAKHVFFYSENCN